MDGGWHLLCPFLPELHLLLPGVWGGGGEGRTVDSVQRAAPPPSLMVENVRQGARAAAAGYRFMGGNTCICLVPDLGYVHLILGEEGDGLPTVNR